MNGPGRPIKALLLEDNTRDVALVTALLEQEGLECDLHHVTTGEEFAVALKKGSFDLIVSDYSLPSFNGFAALALRQEVAQLRQEFVSHLYGQDTEIQRLGECLRSVEQALPGVRAGAQAEDSVSRARLQGS